MELEQDIDLLDQNIQRLKIDFERFFNGALPTPPEEFRLQVQRHIRQLRGTHMPALVQRFRLNTLEARFNTLNELFNRRLREREEGLVAGHAPARAQTSPRLDPYQGIVMGGTPEREAMEALYSELYDPADRAGTKADFKRFQSFVLGQLAKIREKTGCAEVQFRVAREQGELKLKAKPVRAVELITPGGRLGF